MAEILVNGSHESDEYGRIVWWPTRTRCECDNIIDCSSFTNDCSCGIMYDQNGEELNPNIVIRKEQDGT